MMNMTANFPLISLLLATPLAGVLLIWISGAKNTARHIALLTNLVVLAISMLLLGGFDAATAGFQFVEKTSWIPSLNIHYSVGIDGISILFLPLTAILFSAVMLASWTSVRNMPRLYFTLLLILESTILGIFTALDTILFFVFWELTLVPIYFLVSLWGIGPNRRYAAVKYTLFMLTGGIPLLFGFLVLAFNQAAGNVPAQLGFDYISLLATPLDSQTQTIVFLLLLLGFAFKSAVFPFHTWLPTLTMEGPVSIAAIMTGLKVGIYGLIRFTIPLAPEAALEFHWLLAGLGVIGILYGAIVALSQTNIRQVLAYSSISHAGLVVLGLASFNIQGIQGSVYQLLNFTIVAGGIHLVTGFLHSRTGSTDTISLGGVAKTMPLLASFFFLFGLASMGVPGTNGFIAEFLILISSLQTHTGAGLAALAGVVLGAGYFLTLYRRAFLGVAQHAVILESLDLRPRETGIALLLALLILFTGLYPAFILDITRVSAESWLFRLSG